MPSADAATVGQPTDGVCSFKINDAERKYIDSLDRSVGIGASNERARWAAAFEVAFPGASEVSGQFLEQFSGSYISYFNNNLAANVERWAQRVADATGADLDASRTYFTHVWDSSATSNHQPFDMGGYWSELDQAVATGQITVPKRDGFAEFDLIPDRAGINAQLAEEYPSMPRDQRSKWAEAYDTLPDMTEARRVAALMVAFEEARTTCEAGGGTVLLPTDGTNPDAPVTTPPTSTPAAPPVEPGRTDNSVTHTLTNGKTTVTTSVTGSPTTMTNISVSQVTSRTDTAKTTNSGSSASPGVIVGVIVALLVALGAAGAAFAAMGQ